MTKNERLFLDKAQTLLCDIKTIQLDDTEFDKWNKATLIIDELLYKDSKKRGK